LLKVDGIGSGGQHRHAAFGRGGADGGFPLHPELVQTTLSESVP
jgi:hypothetical protein